MTARADAVGEKHGRLTIFAFSHCKNQKSYWLCRCDCGNKKTASVGALRSGSIKSCGCLKTPQPMLKSPEYRAWQGMKTRCYNDKWPSFNDYGARGITVCDRWLNSFDSFLSDMGRRPAGEYSIDRIDNDLGYSPENCRWATKAEQSANRQCARMLTCQGRTMSVTEWAQVLGMHRKTLFSRLWRGMNAEDALTMPVDHNMSRRQKAI